MNVKLNIERRRKKSLMKGGRPFNFAKEIYSIYNLLYLNSAQIFNRVQLTQQFIDIIPERKMS